MVRLTVALIQEDDSAFKLCDPAAAFFYWSGIKVQI